MKLYRGFNLVHHIGYEYVEHYVFFTDRREWSKYMLTSQHVKTINWIKDNNYEDIYAINPNV